MIGGILCWIHFTARRKVFVLIEFKGGWLSLQNSSCDWQLYFHEHFLRLKVVLRRDASLLVIFLYIIITLAGRLILAVTKRSL
jgi:hypothetical protein